MSIDEESSKLLFQVISDSCETRSVIYTTNIEFSGWGRTLGDKNMAAALIDPTVHHGKIIKIQGGCGSFLRTLTTLSAGTRAYRPALFE